MLIVLSSISIFQHIRNSKLNTTIEKTKELLRDQILRIDRLDVEQEQTNNHVRKFENLEKAISQKLSNDVDEDELEGSIP